MSNFKRTKHTPGPWTHEGPLVIKNTRREDFCVADCREEFDDNQAEANARLIAAAPELLEALLEAVEFAPDGSLRKVEWAALIAKATGGAE